ncbi:DNA (cytosine-5)-methyltransferase 3B-like [Oppia nitens]|uniref:DNA (cytosine-5)-methyltransferase 3B-like n=1 Tax=Oppia nitens TaxID=1686743 RepID=UPI0023DB4DD9|nr:DNA (cytosine-5)-methyltransferase 3B-like [Oppia nitens]
MSSEVPLDLTNESKDKTIDNTKLSINSNLINGEKSRKFKRKSRNDIQKVISDIKDNVIDATVKKQRSDNYSTGSQDVNPLQRGRYGLRLLPTQVDYYQSILEDRRVRIYKESSRLVANEETIVNNLNTEHKKTIKSKQTIGKFEFEIGDIVWATLPNYKTWFPALIISHLHCKQKVPKKGQTWVYWFGDHQVSEISKSKIKSFVDNFTDLSKGTSSLTSLRVKEALQVLAVRGEVNIESDENAATSSTCEDEEKSALISWARNGFQLKTGLSHNTAFKANPLNPIPPSAAIYLPLDSVYSEALKTDERLQQIVYYEVDKGESNEALHELPEYKVQQIDRVKNNETTIYHICIACCCDAESLANTNSKALLEHPIFEGGLCRLCHDSIRVTMYAPGSDYKNSFCAICGQLGKLAICENNICHRVYCLKCIDLLIGSGIHLKILETEKWECFICNPKQEMGLLRIQSNWRFNVKLLFDSFVNGLKSLNLIQEINNDKKPIRILSLIDGISSAKLAFDKLGIKVEAYYASESDTTAIEIAKNYYKNSIIIVDSMENLTLEKIASMGPIDLVIGSSPPEYSLNSSTRKSLIENKGSGHYFLYFNHVLHLLRLTNKSRHIFFLCENSNPLSITQRDVISNLFMCKPITLFASDVSHNRNRYYWSNVPGIKRPLPQTIQEKYISLINILSQNVTRKSNSDKSQSNESEDKSFEPKELEKLFELPPDYTNINSMDTTIRQSLLTRSWCQSILCHLIWSLTDFFITDQKNQ